MNSCIFVCLNYSSSNAIRLTNNDISNVNDFMYDFIGKRCEMYCKSNRGSDPSLANAFSD